MADDYETRFAGVGRLYGRAGLERLRSAHIAVVGLGGVGSWAVEALARSGIGALTLIDLDEVCLSNVNRQLPALDGTVGRFKAEVLAERVRAIHPQCAIQSRIEFFTATSADPLLAPHYDAVVDAIDAVTNKCLLVARCRDRGLPVVVCGGAGGRRDPTRLRIDDLADVTHDRLLAEVRKRLRRDHGFAAPGRSMGVPCIHSAETPVLPRPDGTVCRGPAPDAGDTASPPSDPPVRRLACDWGYGSATFVTGAFGFAAAAWVVDRLTRPTMAT